MAHTNMSVLVGNVLIDNDFVDGAIRTYPLKQAVGEHVEYTKRYFLAVRRRRSTREPPKNPIASKLDGSGTVVIL